MHGSLEILFLLLLSLELGIRMKWLGLKAYFKQHPRTILKVRSQKWLLHYWDMNIRRFFLVFYVNQCNKRENKCAVMHKTWFEQGVDIIRQWETASFYCMISKGISGPLCKVDQLPVGLCCIINWILIKLFIRLLGFMIVSLLNSVFYMSSAKCYVNFVLRLQSP